MSRERLPRSPVHGGAVDISGNHFDPRYLAAKKAIDDRALNRRVWETLRRALMQRKDPGPTRILEIGAGIGTMIERFIEGDLLTGPILYVATDRDPEQLKEAASHLLGWANKKGLSFSRSEDDRFRLQTQTADVSVVLIPLCAETLGVRSDAHGPFDLLIAHAVLDLIDFPIVLPRLMKKQLKNQRIAYLTGNFDGETFFLPQMVEDEEILRRYHASMEERLPGASRTGKRLLRFSQEPDLELMDAGPSDWIVHPCNNGDAPGYSTDETLFLHAIIETIERELMQKKDPPPGLKAWTRVRHRQVEEGRLLFLARHMDLLVRCRAPLP